VSESYPYLTLKLAKTLFQKLPGTLEPEERRRVEHVATRQLEIERRILTTAEAAQVILPASSVDQAVAEIRERYPNEEDYLADLEKSGLDPERLVCAVERDLKVNAVLDGVASRVAEVSETDVEIFYLMHHQKFCRPERRTLRHILVTINEQMPGSDRASARKKIDTIRARLARSPRRFAEQALKNSECPTATNGGLLGTLERGQLFPELEPAALALLPGELSAAVESPMGLHILHCLAAEASRESSLASAREKIVAHLTASRRRASQKAWISGLLVPRS
jgi:peptidyl-prolyl cis-trans isomerase C